MEKVLGSILVQTPVGSFHLITQTQDGQELVVAAGFSTAAELKNKLPQSLQNLPLHQESPEHPYANKIKAYFKGDLTAIETIPYGQEGSTFSQAIWKALRKISSGSTVSYAELAERAGYNAAARAAGTACGKNQIMLLVPCHRVVKSDGQPGNYAYGPRIKTWLLAHEAK